MLDYTAEAAHYDRTRGGDPRAEAAAGAIRELLPRRCERLLDVACGTGIVTRRLAAPGRRVVGVDPASGMVARAAERLPGAVVRGDGTRLPFADGAFDAVTAVWLLHLLPDAAPVVAECARVLRPGGVLVVTVDKDAGHETGSDIDALLGPYRAGGGPASDSSARVVGVARTHGLRFLSEAVFIGHGQGRSPRATAEKVRAGWFAKWLTAPRAEVETLAARLDRLPSPDTPRPAPTFRVLSLSREVPA